MTEASEKPRSSERGFFCAARYDCHRVKLFLKSEWKIMSSDTPALDFYFDFSSPYGYLAATRIAALAARHRRRVTWRPILLGPMFKAAGTAPLMSVPLKGPYSARDLLRTARFLQIPFMQPAEFPDRKSVV